MILRETYDFFTLLQQMRHEMPRFIVISPELERIIECTVRGGRKEDDDDTEGGKSEEEEEAISSSSSSSSSSAGDSPKKSSPRKKKKKISIMRGRKRLRKAC